MEPSIAVVSAVAFTAVIQSVFGVGVLLFGTPWLLLLGLGFTEALWLLLPVSLVISALQLIGGWTDVDRSTVVGIGSWSVPAIALTLFLTTSFRPPVELFVALVVLGAAAMDWSDRIKNVVELLMAWRKTYLLAMGVIHGISNLGGSMLAALIYTRFRDRNVARATIAAGYALFAGIQLITLAVVEPTHIPSLKALFPTVVLSGLVYGVVERATAGHVDASRYRFGLSVLLTCTGCLLVFRTTLG